MAHKRALMTLAVASGALMSCAGNGADRNNDGVIDASERAAEMADSSFVPMNAGRWDTRVVFDEIDVPSLSEARKKAAMAELATLASGSSCLSPAEAKNPGADFFGGPGTGKCSYSKFDISGQKAKLELNCAMEGAGAVNLELKGPIAADHFDFDTEAKVRLPVLGAIKLKGKMIGRHGGACVPVK